MCHGILCKERACIEFFGVRVLSCHLSVVLEPVQEHERHSYKDLKLQQWMIEGLRYQGQCCCIKLGEIILIYQNNCQENLAFSGHTFFVRN